MLNWESLQTACLSCTSCPLSQTRHNVVFGVGPQDAEVMFVGEGPGENEDLQGEPFVGAAGKFLDEMLSIIDLGRENCYITNIVKCRPPKVDDGEHFVKKLSSRADKRLALQVLVFSRSLADEHDLRVPRADAENDVVPRLRQRTVGAGQAGSLKRFPVQHAIALLYFRSSSSNGRS